MVPNIVKPRDVHFGTGDKFDDGVDQIKAGLGADSSSNLKGPLKLFRKCFKGQT
jgi:hypothetical protein